MPYAVPEFLQWMLGRYNIYTLAKRADVDVSRLVNIGQGLFKGYSWEWERLERTYQRIQYFRMRIAGVPIRTARQYQTASSKTVDTIIDWAKSLQERIAYYYGLDVKAVRRGFEISHRTLDEISAEYVRYPERELVFI